MTNRRIIFALAVVLISFAAEAQRPRVPLRSNPRIDLRGPADLQSAADLVKEWARIRRADGAKVCQFQAVLNIFIEVDNAMDPMQPNVSVAKAMERLAAANKLVPTDNDSISFQLRTLMITANQIFDPHASPNIPVQSENFHRQVLEPAFRLVTPEVISFVERAQQLDVALQAVSQAQADMSALIVHAIHGDCSASQRE
jgi:hypothetical protein